MGRLVSGGQVWSAWEGSGRGRGYQTATRRYGQQHIMHRRLGNLGQTPEISPAFLHITGIGLNDVLRGARPTTGTYPSTLFLRSNL